MCQLPTLKAPPLVGTAAFQTALQTSSGIRPADRTDCPAVASGARSPALRFTWQPETKATLSSVTVCLDLFGKSASRFVNSCQLPTLKAPPLVGTAAVQTALQTPSGIRSADRTDCSADASDTPSPENRSDAAFYKESPHQDGLTTVRLLYPQPKGRHFDSGL